MSEKLCVPSNLLGTELAEDHVLNQAVQHEIDSRRDREDLKDTAVIGMKVPFQAETSTSDELFGFGTGQSIGFCAIMKTKKKEKPHPADVTCNVTLVFKEEGNSFGVKTKVSTHIFSPSSANPPATPTPVDAGATEEATAAQEGAAPSSAISVRSTRSSRTHNGGLSTLSQGARSLQRAINDVPVPMNIDTVSTGTRRSKRKKQAEEEKSEIV